MRLLLACLALLVANPAFAGDGTARAERMSAILEASGFSGDMVMNAGPYRPGFPTYNWVGLLPERPRDDRDGIYWRWASVTKQVVAVLVLQQVAEGRIDLDQPVHRYLPDFRGPNAARITVRQLLQHRSGLPNPDDTAAIPDAFPAYYLPGYPGDRDPRHGYCAGPAKAEPGGDWSYNNCDYMVLGALLEAVTGTSWSRLVHERIALPLGLKTLAAYPTRYWTRPGRIDGNPEPVIDLATFGASAGLYGDTNDLIAFDVGLMEGKLLPPAALATLWEGDPKLGFMALGQWVFSAPLKGCAGPVRIVERRGEVGGIEIRNLILPDLHVALAILSDRAPFEFGEIWQGKGLSYDLLSAAACPLA